MSDEGVTLSDIPWRWIVFWLVLPNLAVVLLWPFIGVPMQGGLAISGILALLASQLHGAARERLPHASYSSSSPRFTSVTSSPFRRSITD